jgi:hypothetical protein
VTGGGLLAICDTARNKINVGVDVLSIESLGVPLSVCSSASILLVKPPALRMGNIGLLADSKALELLVPPLLLVLQLLPQSKLHLC